MRLFRRKRVENIIFLHLPKAGGTTLRHIFYDQYDYLKKDEVFTINRTKETPDFLALPQDKKNKIKLLVGHFPFGLHSYLKGDFKYVTFMREPIDRVISAYFYNKGHLSSDVYDKINNDNLSLREYLEQDVEPWANNAMTKHLAGCNEEEFTKECTEELFEKALKNLVDNFIAVGLTEQFDESLKILTKKLNWKFPKYENKNITPVKKEKNNIDDITLDLIRKKNEFDIKIYNIGKEIFERDLKKSDN